MHTSEPLLDALTYIFKPKPIKNKMLLMDPFTIANGYLVNLLGLNL